MTKASEGFSHLAVALLASSRGRVCAGSHRHVAEISDAAVNGDGAAVHNNDVNKDRLGLIVGRAEKRVFEIKHSPAASRCLSKFAAKDRS